MDMATGKLFPASQEVCFNSSITADDGLLAHSVSRREGISFEQARAMVCNLSESITAALKADGTFSLSRIGSLQMDSEGYISFKPFTAASRFFNPIMPAVAETELTREQQPKKEVPSSSYYIFRIPRSITRYAAMLAVLILGCISLSMPPAVHDTRINEASVVPIPKFDGIIALPVAEDVPTEPAEEAVETPRYYLIVGASHSEKKCRQFMEMHADFDLAMLQTSASRKLIYLSSAAEKPELLNLMHDEDVVREFGQTWIYDSLAD